MSQDLVKTHFSIHEVVVLTGFSKYMLDYLVREQIFQPAGGGAGARGVRRRYAYADVVVLRALRAVCASKGKIRHLKEALLTFRAEFGPMTPGQRIDRCLVIQGNELCVLSGEEGGRQLRDGQLTLGFVIDLGEVSADVASHVIPGPAPHEFRLTSDAASAAEAVRQDSWAVVKQARMRGRG